ncbi:MAG: ArsA family ATPase [Pseudohongiellaceae bacterium]
MKTSDNNLSALAESKKILFFGGKGGVGKTTVSAATALALANAGRSVLLVSTDPAHNLGHLFEREIGAEPVRLAAGLDGLELDPAKVVQLHLQEVSAALHQLMPVAQHTEIDKHIALSRDAPGMQEAAMLEKMAIVIEEGMTQYDHIIFDTAPSGHTTRLMALPEMMTAWTEGLIKRRNKADRFARFVRELGRDNSMDDKFFGKGQNSSKESRIRQILLRRRRRFTLMRDRLTNPELTSFIIVLTAERLPVLETLELYQQLNHAAVSVGALIVNKRVPANSGDFLTERHAQEERHLHTLNETLGHIPRQDIYLVAHDVIGLAALEKFITVHHSVS